jgi:2-oxoglutarate ferredoxin oxidoreductase subunit alpha
MREAVSLPDIEQVKIIERIRPNVPPEWYKHYENYPKYRSPVASYGEGYRFHVTGLSHDQYGFPTNRADETAIMMSRLENKIAHHIDDLVQVESFMMEDASIAIFAAGITARAAKAAVRIARKSGKKVGLLRPLTIWPFPNKAIREYLLDKKAIIVPELNQKQMTYEIQRIMGDKKMNRVIPMNRVDGELIKPQDILKVIKEVK